MRNVNKALLSTKNIVCYFTLFPLMSLSAQPSKQQQQKPVWSVWYHLKVFVLFCFAFEEQIFQK